MIQARNIFASTLMALIVAAIPVTFSFAYSHPDTLPNTQYQLYLCSDYYSGYQYYSYSPCPQYQQPTYTYYDPYAYWYPTYYYNYGYNYNYNYNNNYNYNGWW